MKNITIQAPHLSLSSFSLDVAIPTSCPICGALMTPDILSSKIFQTVADAEIIDYSGTTVKRYLVLLQLQCSDAKCHSYFQLTGEVELNHFNHFKFVRILPNHYQSPVKVDIDDKIKKVSPDFASIFDETVRAEAFGLSSIVGMGYRRSLEFLVKDFLFYVQHATKPNGEEYTIDELYHLSFSSAIDIIPDIELKNTAKVAAWISNDYTHTEVKWTEESVDSVKEFIKSFEYFIEYRLSIAKANEMVKSKNKS